jgi:hypothetical protein
VSIVTSIFNFLRFNKKNWKAVVLCIFAATVFWFFNALNKNYSTNISFPVAFDYDQDHYLPVKPLPTAVRMNVTGSGWDLFRRSLGFKVAPLVVPLEKPADIQKIVGTTLPAIFAGQLERLKINFVITDTVHLRIQEKIRRKLTIRLDSAQRFIAPDFGLVDEPVLMPDTVWVEGPKQAIESLPYTLQLDLQKGNIRNDFSEDVELKFYNSNSVVTQPRKVNVSLHVEKFETLDRRVKLEIINIPSRLKQGFTVKEVSCEFRLPASSVRTVAIDSLKAVIDLKGTPKGEHKLVPKIIGLPATAQVVKTDTVIVNF